MARLTVLLPEIRRLGRSERLDLWFSRGDRTPAGKPGREARVRECFEFLGTSLPAAALTRSLDAPDAGGVWLRADPSYVAVDAVAVRLLAWDNLALSPEESAELARALRPLFGDAGFPLEPITPQRWYLRCPVGARLPQFAHPDQVLGADLLLHLPRGDNERQWRHLLNEAQVILHNHPVNARRLQRGQVPANSVWFWGAGALPDWVRTSFAQVFSPDPIVVALARKAGARSASPDAAAVLHNATNDTLLDLTEPHADLDQAWLAPIATALRDGTFAQLDLRCESGERAIYKRGYRWRFWRRVRALRA